MIPGEKQLPLEYKNGGKIFCFKTGTIKILRTGAEERPFKGGNEKSQKVSDKDCILKLSIDDFWHLSVTSHFGSTTDWPFVSLQCNTLNQDWTVPNKVFREALPVLSDDGSICLIE